MHGINEDRCRCHPYVMMHQPFSLKVSMRICFVFVLLVLDGIAWVFAMVKLQFNEPNDIGVCGLLV
jgi:hypothetical protein